ncbi:glyoxylase-like metal-dependent hydrolase (beta-lactamase superfamily II) [Cytobacillus eiseniae]|uniref:Glyoxylase-like metal-dependent hydrolase (Beta-lactamase superfamily II) n=1 Tax=Cytobacillus eiseniae TaxID=762947 RepID=A0ABS4RGE6_9BACI|nr:MBL fold metallo-hydrolase [Cytobacillus eiseniae]MBP2240872.1 glyoxylase-like metal-dependent hydrolase (beta-lactamase superfamily II) [Cytobacillus eiseniae]
MEWHQLPLGPLQTNCYIVSKENRTCLIFDPGEESEKLIKWMNEKQLKPIAIILTHAHFDHIGAVDDIRDTYQIPVYVHENEADWLSDPALNGSHLFKVGKLIQGKPADHVLTDETNLTIGDFAFNILKTPGHSPGSLSFYFAEGNLVISGDALFNGSIGRTDLPGGNHHQLLSSIHEQLLILPEETIALPGHGPVTTIGREMDTNPFLNGF